MMLILHPKISDFLLMLASKMAPKSVKNGDQNRTRKGPWKLTENGCQKGTIFESASSAWSVDPDQSPLPNLPLYTRRAQTEDLHNVQRYSALPVKWMPKWSHLETCEYIEREARFLGCGWIPQDLRES